MTVKTLIEKLQQLPPDTLVLRSSQEWLPYLQMLERESAAMKKAISSARQALGAIT